MASRRVSGSASLAWWAGAWLAAVVLGCSGEAAPPDLAIGQRVPFPTTEWTVRTPEEMGMNSAELEKARAYAFQPEMNTQGIVVLRGGAIVAEWYADDRDGDSYAASWSMAKSFASALIGIAIDEGLITSVEQPMKDFIPAWSGQAKGDISLRSVLWMQSGLNFREDYSDLSSEIVRMSTFSDGLSVAQSLQPRTEPDTQWYYSSGDTELLSGVIESVTGITATEYAQQKLFAPIGMDSAQWWTDPAGHTYTYCCIDATVRDFARFGLLFLRDGNWDGAQVISNAWVKESTTTRASIYPGYAYQWWTAESNTTVDFPVDMYSAQGLDTQRILVIPSLDLVIAKNTLYTKPPGAPTTSGFGWTLTFQPRGQLQYGTEEPLLWEDAVFVSHVINAIDGSKKLPAEPSAMPGTSPSDPALCKQRLQEVATTYCEEVQGCGCDACPVQMLDCAGVPACEAIMKCSFDAGCGGIDCLTPCQDVIQANGGVDGAGVQLGLAAVECAVQANGCASACP